MKTITIRDLRQRWPEAEAALQAEDEIIVTRDSKPVAKLVRVTEAEPNVRDGPPKRTGGGSRRSMAKRFSPAVMSHWRRPGRIEN